MMIEMAALMVNLQLIINDNQLITTTTRREENKEKTGQKRHLTNPSPDIYIIQETYFFNAILTEPFRHQTLFLYVILCL